MSSSIKQNHTPIAELLGQVHKNTEEGLNNSWWAQDSPWYVNLREFTV